MIDPYAEKFIPHVVEYSRLITWKMGRWLGANIGKRKEDWECSVRVATCYYSFVREEDKVKFILRWL